jgi:hypothetical protein
MKKQQLYIKNDKGRYEPYKPKEIEDKNVYRKIGNKYVPFAVVTKEDDWFQGGVFVVRSDKHYANRSIAESEYLQECFRIDKIGNNYRILADQLASLEDYVDFCAEELRKYKLERIDEHGYGMSTQEQIMCIIGSVFKFSDILKERICKENTEVRQPQDMNPRF